MITKLFQLDHFRLGQVALLLRGAADYDTERLAAVQIMGEENTQVCERWTQTTDLSPIEGLKRCRSWYQRLHTVEPGEWPRL